MASGDVVNTAARLQSAAPSTGSSPTRRRTAPPVQRVDYETASAVEAKGKSEPIPVWTAVEAHARFGVDVAHEARSELVGRERELAVVQDAFERARHERTPQLLTLVGVPGSARAGSSTSSTGSSKPIPSSSPGARAAASPTATGSRSGRSARSSRRRPASSSRTRRTRSRRSSIRPSQDTLAGTGDEARVESHLLALLGLAERNTARRRSPQRGIRRLAPLPRRSRRAAPARRRRRGHPLGGREPPRLPRRARRLGDRRAAARRRDCAARAPRAPARLGRRQAERDDARARRRSPTSRRRSSSGACSPARCSRPRRSRRCSSARAATRCTRSSSSSSTPSRARPTSSRSRRRSRASSPPASTGFPDSEKSLLQDAAVVGKVFWASSIGRDARRRHRLAPFARAQGLRPPPAALVARRRERVRVRARARPRRRRTARSPAPNARQRHRAVAEWIDGLGRPEDHAEMLAYHWSSALELVRASGGDDDELVERTRLALRDAGDRAFALNSYAVAAAQYEEALALWPRGRRAARAPLPAAVALHYAYDEARQQEALEAARDALLAVGDTERASEAESFLARVFWDRGEHEPSASISRGRRSSPATRSRSQRRRVLAFSAPHPRDRRRDGRRAGGSPRRHSRWRRELGLDELRAHALTTIGMAKNDVDVGSGDRRHGARARDRARGRLARRSDRSSTTSPCSRRIAGDFPRTDELYAEALRLAERFGDAGERSLRPRQPHLDRLHARALGPRARAADAFIAECEAGSPHTLESLVREVRAAISLARGDVTGALRDQLRAFELAREADPFQRLGALAVSAATLRRARAAGRGARARGTGPAAGPGDRPAWRADPARAVRRRARHR